MTERSRCLAVIGPTASGKSSLALSLARRHPELEIVSVDSMQVYRGMDIGTAKPTAVEQREVRHHLIDLVEPEQDFTVVEFQQAYREVVADIEARGRRPLLVGGTGLYLRSVVDALEPPPQWPAIRERLEAETDTEALHQQLGRLDPAAAEKMEPSNRRRIVRALEVTIGSGRPFSSFGPGLESYPPTPVTQIGIRRSRDDLTERIADRYRVQMAQGFLDEVRMLAGRTLSRTARQALGYKELLEHVEGRLSLDDALDLAVRRTRTFAVRQERWFRRDPRIVWVTPEDFRQEAEQVLAAWAP
ncbi:MAG: tRNA (adenosine(37)-N6)-dimethylallyltransferase MiaA [Acidimicrobiia bacterium]